MKTVYKPIILQRQVRRFFCTFLPFFIRKQAGAATPEHWDEHPTSAFDKLGPASAALMDEIIAWMPNKDAAILDMGCNVGRHLNYLYQKGYKNLSGVDFSNQAIMDMRERYPDMYADSQVAGAAFQVHLATINNNAFDIVYTRGATFELVHPSYPLIKNVCAIARSFVIMVISESGHSYPRFWEYEFARNGFELVHLRRPASMEAESHRVSLMTFRRLDQ